MRTDMITTTNHNYCVLFDKNYLTRGLVLHASLMRHAQNFTLWILCMDDVALETLKKLNLPNVKLIKLSDLEDSELLVIKPTRTMTEYCWTLSSSLPLYILRIEPGLKQITYLDTDLYFFSSPQPIFDELGDDSVLIVRHNYSERLRYLEKRSGVYNVALVIVNNDERGVGILKWWRERCLEWCYAHFENGKLGDQMYLDDWTERFKGVHVLKHKGANLAPWNVSRYVLTQKNGQIFVDEDPLIFYHYHSLKLYADGTRQLYYSSYRFSPSAEQLLYPPYLKELSDALARAKSAEPAFNYGFSPKPGVKLRLKYLAKRMLVRMLSSITI